LPQKAGSAIKKRFKQAGEGIEKSTYIRFLFKDRAKADDWKLVAKNVVAGIKKVAQKVGEGVKKGMPVPTRKLL
jgi:hypothetical protein